MQSPALLEGPVPPWLGLRAELARLWNLAWPVSLGMLGFLGMFTADTIMVGHLGKEPLAAVAIGNLWAGGWGIVTRGIVHGMDPVVAQAFGAGDRDAAGQALVRGLLLAFLLTVPLVGIYWVAEPGLRLLGQPEELLPTARIYVRALCWGAGPHLAFWAIRQFLAGLGDMRPPTWIILAANVVNVAMNALFIYGLDMGVPGAGYATSISQTFMLLALVWLVRDRLRDWWPARPDLRWTPMRQLLGLGVPIGIQIGLEVWAFQAALVMMGWLGPTELAAQAVTVNLVALAFMIPLGISTAAATRVGNLLGAGYRWQPSGWTAIGVAASWMLVSAALFLSLSEPLARLYTPDTDVILLAATLIPIAGAFQLFDGVQVACFGVLRGAGDVWVPSLFNVFGYWVFGLPLGGWLAFRAGWGPVGIWVGMLVALAIVATLILLRVWTTGRRGGFRVTR